ncbi:hypothetical protein M0R45_007118 [Rubus argutus]|uniref:Uncharacterized protein n=1 Tax=Rubus argutus TaxID=59490 RepID=A0AAW1YU70_RUBAR
MRIAAGLEEMAIPSWSGHSGGRGSNLRCRGSRMRRRWRRRTGLASSSDDVWAWARDRRWVRAAAASGLTGSSWVGWNGWLGCEEMVAGDWDSRWCLGWVSGC